MTSKLSLLGGIAASAILFAAGGAAAEGLTVTSYKLATEATVPATGGVSAPIVLTLPGATKLPNGTAVKVVYTITGGVLDVGAPASVVAAGGVATSNLTSGPAGASTFTYLVVASDADVTGFTVTPTIRPTGNGDVFVRATVHTLTGDLQIGYPTYNTVIGVADEVAVIARKQAFTASFFHNDRETNLATPPYRDLDWNTGMTTMGEIDLNVDTSVMIDLGNTPAAVGNVASASVVISGDYAGFITPGATPVLQAELGGVAPASFTSSSATWSGAAVLTAMFGGADFDLDPVGSTGQAIRATIYKPQVTLTFNPLLNLSATPFVSSMPNLGLGSVTREGTNVVLPGMQSKYLFDRLGDNNQVRIGNSSDSGATVYATVLSQKSVGNNPPAYTNAGAVEIGVVDAGGEMIINTSLLTSKLGEFGRGDVELTIEADSELITVRRMQRSAGGHWNEVSSGTVYQDQY